MKKIKIGDLRQRVTIESAVVSSDGYGGRPKSWVPVATVWAKVEPLRGREYFEAHQIKTEVTHRVIIRYRPDVTPQMRIKVGSRYLMIESVIDIEERHRFLELICREEG